MDCAGVLIAVSDVLVVKTLESMGKRLVRTERSRFRMLGGAPFHLAHTMWQIEDTEAARALRGAWDVVPLLIGRHCLDCPYDPAEVVAVLDEYVRDLVITGTPHRTEELVYRFDTRLTEEEEDQP